MNIPFVDLKKQYQENKKHIDKAITDVIFSTEFIHGKKVAQFEEHFAKYIGVKNSIGLNSGTDALLIGIKALELHSGDEVILPVNTFIATANAVELNGLKPVFVDVDEEDNGIDLQDLQRKISSRTKAVIVVHLYGQADKLDEINAVIKKIGRKIHLIEDACQAHGALYKGKKVGGFGSFAAFSFYPGKNLGAYGDAGAVTTNSSSLSRTIRLLANHGQNKKYHHQLVGFNSRLDTIQAAILNYKLSHLDEWNKKRQRIAAKYSHLLKNLSPNVTTPGVYSTRQSIYHLYVVKTKKRNSLAEYLMTKGIQTLVHYPIPLHLQPAFKKLHYSENDFPHAEHLAGSILSLPIYPELSENKIKYIVTAIKQFYEKN